MRYKSELRQTKHQSPHRTIEAPRTPRSRGGRRGRVASGGSSAPEPPRATRNTPEFIRNFPKNTLSFFIFLIFRTKELTSAG